MRQPAWVVTDVKAHEDYTLVLTFADGKRGVYDASVLLDKPLYARLRDVSFFLTAHIDGPSVAWDEETDVSPEYLYANTH